MPSFDSPLNSTKQEIYTDFEKFTTNTHVQWCHPHFEEYIIKKYELSLLLKHWWEIMAKTATRGCNTKE